MNKIFTFLLTVLLLAGFATSALAGAANMNIITPWKTIEDVAPGAIAKGMLGVEYPVSQYNGDLPKCMSDLIIKGTVITGVASNGTTHCWGDGTDNASHAFDANCSTFFDPYDAVQESWCGLLLDQPYELSEVRICNRDNSPDNDALADRISGGAIQGSNDSGATWTTLIYFKPSVYGTKTLMREGNGWHIVTPNRTDEYIKYYTDNQGLDRNKADFSVYWVQSGYYSMFRYVNLDGNHGDVAEIELYGHPAKGNIEFTEKSASTRNGSVAGKVIGSGGLWVDGINGYADAWDGNGNTFYDPKNPGPSCWTGLLAEFPAVLSEVWILPRLEFFDRTAGAYLQGSNDGTHWDTLASFTANDCLREGAAQSYIKKTVKSERAYWMFRYINDGSSHGDVADITLIGKRGEAALTYPGIVVGKVLSTDIRAYINGAEIPAYNVDGKLAVIVSDLNNYGFKTKYDNGARKTRVTRDKGASTFTSVPSKASGQPIGTALMNVLSSDIIVELDGKQVPAFNVDNRMAIPFSELKEYGEYKYDNGTRTSSITLK